MTDVTWAIIQARMGSTRLRGKVLKPLAGVPALVHVIGRTRAIEGVSRVVVATSTRRSDNPIVEVVESWFDGDVGVHRGPEHDVLARFVGALGDDPPPYFFRITADSPLLSFEHATAIRNAVIREDADGADSHQHETGLTTGLGSEFYRTYALLQAAESATDKKDREHVTTWIKRESKFRILYPEPLPELVSDYRLTLDFPEDYEVLRTLYQELYEPGELIDSADAIRWMALNPDVARINENCPHRVVA